MEDRLFPHLKAGEPEMVELTKKQYDDYRDIEQFRASGKRTEDVKSVLPEAPVEEVSEVVQREITDENTKREIIAEILKRGSNLTSSELGRKNKSQLLDLI